MIKVIKWVIAVTLITGLSYMGFMKIIFNEQSSADIQGLGKVYVGSTIVHAKFGSGTVKAIHKNEENYTLRVAFQEHGTKALIAEHSPIKIQQH